MLKFKFIVFCLFTLFLLSVWQVLCITEPSINHPENAIKTYDSITSKTYQSENPSENNLENSIDETINSYMSLIEIYGQNKQYRSAIKNQYKLLGINDSLNDIEKAKVLDEIQSKLETVKQDKEIAIVNARNVSQERKIEQQNLQRYIYFSAGLSVFILVIGLVSRLYYMRQTRIELIVKSKKIAIEKKRAEENEKVKEQFLSKMSHEIRTPMNAIMGITNILRKRKHFEHQEKYLEAIWKSSENLLVILNDIIDLSKLETGKIKIEKVAFKPLDELMRLRELLKFKAEEKGIELMCELDERIPESLMGDPTRLNQIMVNLVGNALKFTDEGNVFVSIYLKEIIENIAVIGVDIKDTGIGIPKEQINKIFESFTQVDSDTSKKYAGTGLGLTISRDLVQLQGGKIKVESEPGKGSVFSFEIPYELAEYREIVNTLSVADKNQLKGLNVLLVEDNEFNIMVAIDELKEIIDDVKIDQVENGLEALNMVSKKNYDIILMDIEMEQMNGYEAATAIRQLPPPKSNVPIIAITASALKADIEKCFEAGMNEHIAKPFTPSELRAKIESLISKHSQT